MKRSASIAVLGLVVSLGTAGCMAESQSTPLPAGPMTASESNSDKGLGELVYLAAQTAAERAGGLSKSRPIVVATMVSIDDLNQSSTFGRLASQLIANRLAQRGYMVRDITFMRALEVSPNGELALSRDAAHIGTSINAQAVVTGTYAVAGAEVYLNIRFLKPDDGEVLSSADVAIPLNGNTFQLAMSGCTHEQRVQARIAAMNEYTGHQSCN
jgi:hypothetical protein